jgi:hypothetical protein
VTTALVKKIVVSLALAEKFQTVRIRIYFHCKPLFQYAMSLKVLYELERIEHAPSYMTQRHSPCYETQVLQLSAEGMILTFLNKLEALKSCN